MWTACAAALFGALVAAGSGPDPPNTVRAADAQRDGTLAPGLIADSGIDLRPEMPVDVSDGSPDSSLLHDVSRIPESQRVFDKFAWQMFVSLNWAGKQDGLPDEGYTLEHDVRDGFRRPRVWENWAETNVLFKALGAEPAPWEEGHLPQWGVGSPLDPSDEVVWMTAKVRNRNVRHHTSLADENVEAFTAPLVDQNGKWVRFQVRLNRTEYEFVRVNKLYSLEGQAEYLRKVGTIEFPIDGDTVNGKQVKYGSIEIKLAWKQLGAFQPPAAFQDHRTDAAFLEGLGLAPVFSAESNGAGARESPRLDHYFVADDSKFARHVRWFDDRNRFLWRYVRVIHGGSGSGASGTPVPDPIPVPLGMVGMHVAVRTRSSPQWIWATFEHVDNVAVNDLTRVTLPDGTTHRLRPLFNNPDRPADPVNIQPEPNIKPDPDTGKFTDWDEAKTTTPVQVFRVLPVPPATAELNGIVQGQLRAAGSVLQYYELIGVQWPVEPQVPAFPSGMKSAPESVVFKVPGHVVPTFVANTTMETYFQGGNQQAGGQERDNRPPKNSDDPTLIFATESCAGCHYSAGACVGFKTGYVPQPDGTVKIDYLRRDGRKIPIFGIDSHQGHSANANFSWLLQMKAQSNEPLTPQLEAAIRAVATQPTARASINSPGSDPEQIPQLPRQEGK